MISVVVVIGTRPEAIKLAPVVHALRARPARFRLTVCATAQHRDLLDQVLDLFEITPDVDLDLMRPGQTLTEVTCGVLEGLRPLLEEHRPDWLLVQGDTTTTMAAALAAFYQQVRVGHVEAGLRTGNKYSPWPEEINRRLTGTIADLHFAPTERARENLRREGIPESQVLVTGNTAIDALHWVLEHRARDRAGDGSRRGLVLVTAHRRENFGPGISQICEAIRTLADRFPDLDFVYPVHPNPNVRAPAQRLLAGVDNVQLVQPLDYLPFVELMQRSSLILTDSGGIQEEAPSLGKPVLVLRDTTERPEGVEAGTVKLVGTDPDAIVGEATRLLTDPDSYARMATVRNPYGDGRAAERIVRALSA